MRDRRVACVASAASSEAAMAAPPSGRSPPLLLGRMEPHAEASDRESRAHVGGRIEGRARRSPLALAARLARKERARRALQACHAAVQYTWHSARATHRVGPIRLVQPRRWAMNGCCCWSVSVRRTESSTENGGWTGAGDGAGSSTDCASGFGRGGGRESRERACDRDRTARQKRNHAGPIRIVPQWCGAACP